MEYCIIILFSSVLLTTVFLEIHLLYALSIGFLLFFGYGLYKGCSIKELLQHSLDGPKNIGSLLFLFCLIGILTATWRACGTIAFLVVNSTYILIPSLFIFSTFLLCLCISMLTGTAFGTSATMGLICMTMGNVLNIDPAHLGGAILSGSYFGDRMSPMSSSAHLIAKLTMTNIFSNIKNMFRSSLWPCCITCVLYIFLGLESSGTDIPHDTLMLFEKNFALPWYTATPAIVMIVLAFAKVSAKIIMAMGILLASMLCLFAQNMSLPELLQLYWFGFQSNNPQLHAILGGGGLQSMVTVSCIVAISSAYMGIFSESHFFDTIHAHIAKLAQKTSTFGSTALVTLATCMVTCNQTLTILLTKSLCEKQYDKKLTLAHAIENTAVLMPALIPWNIACSVVIANVDAPVTSVYYAFFLYLVPMLSYFSFKKEA